MPKSKGGQTGGYGVREAVADDMDRVGQIARRAWAPIHDSFSRMMGTELHSVVFADWENQKEAQVRRHWERYPEWFRVVESEGTGEVVGFISFRIDREKLLGTIGNNAVAPEAQGQGIGPVMYAAVLDVFRREGCRFATVGTGLDEGHARARRAYEKAGFDIAVPQVAYYQRIDESANGRGLK